MEYSHEKGSLALREGILVSKACDHPQSIFEQRDSDHEK